MIRKLAAAAIGLSLIGMGVAWAIQPGTTGTEKRYQQQGLRSGVLLQRNATATASGGAATLNAAGSGIITTEALSTTAGSNYTLTLTNNMVSAGDVVLASVQYGTATTGQPYVSRVTPGSGSVVIIVRNGQSAIDLSVNGTLKIAFFVLKQNANGQD